MNSAHHRIIKIASLRDKEAEKLLVQLYYETPHDDRAALLDRMLDKSKETADRLKTLELTKLEAEEAKVGSIIEAAEEASAREEEAVRGEEPGGDDEASGDGGSAGG